MRKLSRHLNSLSTQHEEAVAVHDSGKHAAEIVELDTKKFRIAKAASELEIESERLESELEMLKERLVDLESQGLEGDETTRREREADDATMCVPMSRSWIDTLANIYLAYGSRSSVLSVLISSPTRRAISTERSFAIAAKAMFMSSISTRNSPASSTQTTFGQRCKDNHDGGRFCGCLTLAFYFWRPEAVSFYRCWCFYTLGLFSVIRHTIIVHTFQPYGCLDIACFSGSRAFTRL